MGSHLWKCFKFKFKLLLGDCPFPDCTPYLFALRTCGTVESAGCYSSQGCLMGNTGFKDSRRVPQWQSWEYSPEVTVAHFKGRVPWSGSLLSLERDTWNERECGASGGQGENLEQALLSAREPNTRRKSGVRHLTDRATQVPPPFGSLLLTLSQLMGRGAVPT